MQRTSIVAALILIVLGLIGVLVRVQPKGDARDGALGSEEVDAATPTAARRALERTTTGATAALPAETPAEEAPSEASTGPSETSIVFCRVVFQTTRAPVTSGSVVLSFHGPLTGDRIAERGVATHLNVEAPLDSHGEARLAVPTGLRLDDLRVEPSAAAREFIPAARDDVALVAGPETAREALLIVVSPGGSLTGRLVDAQTGLPIVGARLVCDSEEDRALRTDDQGRFRFSAIGDAFGRVPPTVDLVIAAAGYRARSERLEVTAPGAAAEEHVIRLTRGVVIAGRVLDPSVRPIGQAELILGAGPHAEDTGAGLRELVDFTVATADADGRFRFTAVAHRGAFQITARAAGHGSTGIAVVAHGDRDDVEITLHPQSGVLVRAVDEAGRPIAPERWRLIWQHDDESWQCASARTREGYRAWTPRGARVPVRGYSVASAREPTPLAGDDVIRGGDEEQEIVLRPAERQPVPAGYDSSGFVEGCGTRLTLELRDAAGRPLHETLVYHDLGRRSGGGRFLQDGVFRLVIEPGLAHLELRPDGFRPRFFSLRAAPNADVRLALDFERMPDE